MPIKKRHIVRLLFKTRRGLLQAKKYNKKAKEFWKNKEPQMIEEITRILEKSSDKDLVKISRDFVERTNFPELTCKLEEIREFKRILKHFGSDIVIPDFVRYGTRTGFLTVVIAPALAAAEGLGDVDEKNIEEWLYGIGICLPVSADVCDSVLDEEVLKHTLIPHKTWIICHKLGAALIFHIGLKHVREIKTTKKIQDKIMKRLNKGIKKVSEKQRMDFRVKNMRYVPLSLLEEIYDGKICEIESTVFATIPSQRTDIVKMFEQGAHFFAGELQIADDFEDLLGDVNINKLPELPNPSFFLTYCIDSWKDGERDVKKIMIEAAKKTLEKGDEYHGKVIEALNKLPKKFKTKPFFEVTLWYYNRVLNDRFKQFLKGKTYPDVRPQLLKILK